MKINLYEEKFIEVNDIILIKTYMKRLSEYRVTNDNLMGSIFIDLSYFDKDMLENFKTLELPYAVILKDTISVSNVELNDVEVELVDQKGINIKYNLDINYDIREDKEFEEILEESKDVSLNDNNNEESIIEVNEINVESNEQQPDDNKCEENETKTQEELINDNVKESIKNDYDKMLDISLKNREEVKITSTENETEDSFLDFFNTFEAKYLHIKKIMVREDNLASILNENNLDSSYIEEGYDRDNQILTIKSYE